MSKEIRLSIPAMKCNGCVTAIEKALGAEISVSRSEVDLESRTALVETSSDLSVLLGALKSAGFEATETGSQP